jgi:hypothetical protein
MKILTPMRPRKRDYEKAVRKTISMPSLLCDVAVRRSRLLGCQDFSHYVQNLLRADNQDAMRKLSEAA